MLEKVPDRNFDAEDSSYLLPSPDAKSWITPDAPSNRFRALSWITLERLTILFLSGLLSYCVYFIAHHNQARESNAADGFTISQYGVDRNYMTLSHASDHLWDDLTLNHENGGVVWSADGNEDGKETVGVISMFHQLHCLASFRKAMQAASHGEEIGMDWNDNGHWPHCFDYMRKSILCFADDTIERPLVIDGTLQHSISGSNDTRNCRQSNVLYDILREKDYYGDESPDK